MTPKTGEQIAAEAYTAFDKWCAEHANELEHMDIFERVDAYGRAMTQEQVGAFLDAMEQRAR